MEFYGIYMDRCIGAFASAIINIVCVPSVLASGSSSVPTNRHCTDDVPHKANQPITNQ